MNERLPYEEQLAQQWSELPLPDENMAWADMKRRMEEDDDDGIIVWWRRGCALWGLLLLLLLVIGWFFLRDKKWFVSDSKKQQTVIEKKEDGTEKNKLTGNDSTRFSETSTSINTSESNKVKNPSASTDENVVNGTAIDTLAKQTMDPSQPTGRATLPDGIQTDTISRNHESVKNKRTGTQKNRSQATPGNDITIGRNGPVKKPSVITDHTVTDTMTRPGIKRDKRGNDTVSTDISKTNVAAPQKIDTVKAKDSLKKAGVTKKQQTDKNEVKKDSTKPKKFFFSVGIAEQQQLPINGQKLTPYNASGRKGTLSDYIPSVYFRYTKENKWFIQSEFRYGAPQYNKEFVYGDKAKTDTVATTTFVTTTLQKLKKTYYHQLSASFNYYVMPQWSLGGGVVWNKFSSAIIEQNIFRLNNTTLNDSVIQHGIITDKNTSVFSNSYFQGLFETQYQWKRFTLGARYSMGLQPYIKFTLSSGNEQQEKNSSVQLFLRYELWRSKNR